jgi:integrase/recombinase XerD
MDYIHKCIASHRTHYSYGFISHLYCKCVSSEKEDVRIMPVRLSTTVSRISSIPNSVNSRITYEFHQYVKSIGISDSYQNGNLKIIIYFSRFLGSAADFLSVIKKEQILSFLDTRIKNTENDLDKKWIRTWNDYLQRIKYFFRWLYNKKEQEIKGIEFA